MVEKLLTAALGQDVTQLAAEEKQRLLSRLLARLAHEIRNPLSSLAIHVQLLEEDMTQAAPPLKAQAAGRFEIIRSELHRLESLMRQFLSLASPSSVDLQTVEVAEVVRYVCELLRPEAAERGIEIAMDIPEALPPLTVDPGQLKQALINLVINAIQAVERNGRIEIIVRADPSAGTASGRGGGSVRLQRRHLRRELRDPRRRGCGGPRGCLHPGLSAQSARPVARHSAGRRAAPQGEIDRR